MLVINKDDLTSLLNIWSEAFEVYTPQKADGQVMLLPYEENELTLDYVNFSFPVKEYIYKQKEKLFAWEKNEKTIKVDNYANLERPKKILFGVRPCDVYGISYMDKFFLEGFNDDVYEKNRKSTYIVATNCIKPGENCFCASMGVGPFAEAGYDILLTPIEDDYLIEVGSEKGEELLALGKELLTNVDENILDKKNVILDKAKQEFTTVIKADDVHKVLEENFDNSLWEKLSKECIRCTGCTSVCPTCTCFNVVEENKGSHSGCRGRYWDSCQSDSFTRNAGDHNPRTPISRVRYRIYDKMKYIEEKFGMKGCTGCGRCTNVCPAYINIVNIINNLAEKSNVVES